jgi:hypothetical protein
VIKFNFQSKVTPMKVFLSLKFINLILLAAGVMLILACGVAAPSLPPTEVPTSTVIPTPAPTKNSLPLFQQVTLTSTSSEVDNPSPLYKITTKTPSLTGSDDPRVKNFNAEMTARVNIAIADFKQNLTMLTNTPITAGSSFDVRYTLLSPPGNILSLKFEMEGYISGSAHPYHLSQTVNYDLEQGKDIALVDLFIPISNYLEAIASYCAAQLKTRDIGFEQGFSQGADPIPENYRNWNITQDGLLITFDEYQVAPYAVGPQTVVVPFSELKSLINPQGELGIFIQ